jgi:hypothetical protein
VLKLVETVSGNMTGTNNLLEAKADGSFDFSIDLAIAPADVKGNTRVDLARAEALMLNYADSGGGRGDHSTEMREWRSIRAGWTASGTTAGQWPFLLAKPGPVEDRRAIHRPASPQCLRRSRRVGFCFHARLERGRSSRNWRMIVPGNINGQQVSLTRNKHPLRNSGSGEFQSQVNSDQTAVLQKLNVQGKRQQKELHGFAGQTDERHVGASARGFTESNFRLALKELDPASGAPHSEQTVRAAGQSPVECVGAE